MLAPNKMGMLTASLIFLGLEVDFNLMEMQFPLSKAGELKDMVQQWLGRRSKISRELESLMGNLAHACTVIKSGDRTFIQRMFKLLKGTCPPLHHIRLSQAFRSDLQLLASFLETWNGIALLQEQGDRKTYHVVRDALRNGILDTGNCGSHIDSSCTGPQNSMSIMVVVVQYDAPTVSYLTIREASGKDSRKPDWKYPPAQSSKSSPARPRAQAVINGHNAGIRLACLTQS